MFRKKKRYKGYNDPSVNFMDTMLKEAEKDTGLHLKVERIPQGFMANHIVSYVPVYLINHQQGIESQIKYWFGGGCYNLTIVDVEHRPMESVRSLWVHIGGEDMQGGAEIRRVRAETKFVKSVIELSVEKKKEETNQMIDILKMSQDACRSSNDTMLNWMKIGNEILFREKNRRDGVKEAAQMMAGLFLMQKKERAEMADKKKKELEEFNNQMQKLMQPSASEASEIHQDNKHTDDTKS